MNNNNKIWSGILIVCGIINWYFPQWNGIAFNPTLDITSGDGHIISTIFIVGGLLLWYLPKQNQNSQNK